MPPRRSAGAPAAGAAAAPPAAAAKAPAPGALCVRMFVGGVAAGVTGDELAARFAPFGAVTSVAFVQGKAEGACAAVALRVRATTARSLR